MAHESQEPGALDEFPGDRARLRSGHPRQAGSVLARCNRSSGFGTLKCDMDWPGDCDDCSSPKTHWLAKLASNQTLSATVIEFAEPAKCVTCGTLAYNKCPMITSLIIDGVATYEGSGLDRNLANC